MAEQRIVGAGPVRAGVGPVRGTPAPTKVAAAPAEPAKKARRWPVVALVVVALLAVGIAGAALTGKLPFFSDGGSTAAAEASAPERGESVDIEAISVNLADNHYLRVGFTMQMSADATEVATAPAKDAAIELFSGHRLADINDEATRKELKEQLLNRLNELFEGHVIDIYYTDFVTQ
ncbi:flagellar basal body-associated FliL family protein [Actinomycetaceae bacterium L2_0104]